MNTGNNFLCGSRRLGQYLQEQLGNDIFFNKSVEEFPSVDEFRDAIDVDYKEQY